MTSYQSPSSSSCDLLARQTTPHHHCTNEKQPPQPTRYSTNEKQPPQPPQPPQPAHQDVPTSEVTTTRAEANRFVVSLEKPRRALSAYNLFFKSERKRLLLAPIKKKKDNSSSTTNMEQPHTSSKGNKNQRGFAEVTRTIAAKWKQLDSASKIQYEQLARTEKLRYKEQLVEWRKRIKSKTKVLKASVI